MKKNRLHTDTGDEPIVPSFGGQQRAEAIEKDDAESAGPRADGLLAKRRLAGEVGSVGGTFTLCVMSRC